ncbi:MAG: hypothetical protein GF421_03075 [Candidatus Aminicenantes bacterium]|nr:hypothetical protein [Candidatus Aminicenantes bacterium]
MISHKFKCIFIHIPKTGGTSVEKSLWTDFSRKNLFGRPNFTQTGVLHHLKAIHVQQKVGEDIFKKYFKYTFVRNPWSRVLSQYFYTIQVRKDFQRMLGISKDSSFKDYVRSLQKVNFNGSPFRFVEIFFNNIPYMKHLSFSKLHTHWEKQNKFIIDEHGNQLVDFIGRFENLQEDFNQVCDRLGIPHRQLPHETVGVSRPKGKHYSEYYDQETKCLVEEIYWEDIERFNYGFETSG